MDKTFMHLFDSQCTKKNFRNCFKISDDDTGIIVPC